MSDGNMSLSVDYASINAAADQISTDSEKYKRIATQLLEDINGLKGSWQGKETDVFFSRITDCCDKLQNMAVKLKESSELLNISRMNYEGTQQAIYDSGSGLPV